MGTQGRLEPHEVAVLRRAHAFRSDADPEVARALLTCEHLFHERAEVRALLLRIQGASCGRIRQLVRDLRATLGEH